MDDQADRLHHRLALEGGTTGQDLVKDRAQRVDVGRRADVLGSSHGLLGSHVAGRAHDVAGLGLVIVRFQPLGQPEVGDLGCAVSGQEHVGRLEVAVDDPGLMRGVNGPGQGRHQLGGRDARLGCARQSSRRGLLRRETPAIRTACRPLRRCRRSARCSGAGAGRPPRPRSGSGPVASSPPGSRR